MTYTDDLIRNLTIDYLQQSDRLTDLLINIVRTDFGNNESKNFANHGLGRRIRSISRAFRRLFECIPIEIDCIPEKDAIDDASISIQALIANSYGVLDNIAWIWVYANPDNENFLGLRRNRIGLTSSHRFMRQNLPQDFVDRLLQYDDWIEHVKETRDALAHRVPIYIPPYTVRHENSLLYNQLEQQKFEDLANGDFEALEATENAQRDLCAFKPIWVREVGDRPEQFLIHPQAIIDVMTVCELSEAFVSIFQN